MCSFGFVMYIKLFAIDEEARRLVRASATHIDALINWNTSYYSTGYHQTVGSWHFLKRGITKQEEACLRVDEEDLICIFRSGWVEFLRCAWALLRTSTIL